MKLISMVDFVLKSIEDKQGKDILDYRDYAYNKLLKIENYANFLNQPLELGMFVPCDEDGNVLEKPNNKDYYDSEKKHSYPIESDNCQQAKLKVLFEGFELKILDGHKTISNGIISIFWFSDEKGWYLSNGLKTIKDLVKYNLTLTDNAIKKINL